MLLGPEGRVETCLGAEETAARLLSRGDEELTRTLSAAAANPEDRSTLLWLLIRGFHLMSHRRQCELVLRTCRGFSALSAAEQAEVFLSIVPRVRKARRGWQNAKPRPVYRGNVSADSGSQQDNSIIAEVKQEGHVPPLVGTQGRRDADSGTVEMLDAAEVALRRLKQSELRRLYRRLDRGISEGLPPTCFAKMLAELPLDEVRALEAWVVDEGGMSESGARQLFNTMLQATAAKDAVCDVGEKLADRADAVWAGLAKEITVGDEGGFWPEWLQGRHSSTNSPRDSLAGESAVSSRSRGGWKQLRVVTKAALNARRIAAEAEMQRTAVLQQGGYPDEDVPPPRSMLHERGRTACQLHCPADRFLWGIASASVAPASETSVHRKKLGEDFGL